VDSVPDLTVAIDAMAQEHGCQPLGEMLVRTWVGNGAAALVQRAMVHSLENSDEVMDDLHPQWLNSFLRHYTVASGQHAQLYDGVRATLEQLKLQGIPMAPVTNKPMQFVPDLLASLNVEGYFDTWLGGDSLPHKKPNPAPLQFLLDHFDVSADQALMVGDSRSDIMAAKAAGSPVLAVNYGYNHGCPVEQENPDWVVSNLQEAFDATRLNETVFIKS